MTQAAGATMFTQPPRVHRSVVQLSSSSQLRSPVQPPAPSQWSSLEHALWSSQLAVAAAGLHAVRVAPGSHTRQGFAGFACPPSQHTSPMRQRARFGDHSPAADAALHTWQASSGSTVPLP